MTLLVTYASLALGVSFLCSIMEAVLLSVTPAYVKSLGDSLNTTKWLHELKDDLILALLGQRFAFKLILSQCSTGCRLSSAADKLNQLA